MQTSHQKYEWVDGTFQSLVTQPLTTKPNKRENRGCEKIVKQSERTSVAEKNVQCLEKRPLPKKRFSHQKSRNFQLRYFSCASGISVTELDCFFRNGIAAVTLPI